MRIRITLTFAIALSAFAFGAAHAAIQDGWKAKKPADAVAAFKAELSIAKVAALEASLASDSDSMSKASASRDDAKADLDKLLPLAVAGAKGKPDLIKAIKGCYVTTQSYLDGMYPTSLAERVQHKRMESELDKCENELTMEMKLAGI